MIATVLIVIVALIHAYIVVLEMALWTTPRGRRAFGMSVEKAELTKVLAANQGLYNGFLVAGLAWGLWLGAGGVSPSVSIGGGSSRYGGYSASGVGVGVGLNFSGPQPTSTTLEVVIGRGAKPDSPYAYDARSVQGSIPR